MTLIEEINHDLVQHPLDRDPVIMARALEEIVRLRAELDATKKAAPDLLEACELALASDDRAVKEVLRAAIAKTKGVANNASDSE